MSSEPENLVLAHLRELRAELRDLRADLSAQIATVNERLTNMQEQGRTALRNFVGHRSMTERAFAGVESELSLLAVRVTKLEDQRPNPT